MKCILKGQIDNKSALWPGIKQVHSHYVNQHSLIIYRKYHISTPKQLKFMGAYATDALVLIKHQTINIVNNMRKYAFSFLLNNPVF